MKKIQLSLILLLLIILSCKTENSSKPAATDTAVVMDENARAAIDSLLSKFVEDGDIAGVSALVYEKGKEAYYNAFGFADKEKGIRMQRNTIVQIYSMTKPITGVSLMTLYEKDRFELDDALYKHAPIFKDMKVYEGVDDSGKMKLVDAKRPISIRDITRHTAGFPNRQEIPGLGTALAEASPMDPENTLSEMAAKFAALPLWFHPGEQWEYGPSVDIQAYLVEQISGEDFEAYTRAQVLDPLQMNETRYFVPEKDRSRFAAMYWRDSTGDLQQLPDEEAKANYLKKWPLKRGGSGLTSTLDNYMRFARMLLNKGELDGARILRPETVELMATNQLPDSVEERSWLPSKGRVGFGIDFAVRMEPPASAEENHGKVGEYFWDGAASTLFWIDPANDLAAVLFVQLFPYDPIRLHKKFRDAVYGDYTPE